MVVGVKIDKQKNPYTLILNSHADIGSRQVKRLDISEGANVEVPFTSAVANGVRSAPVEHIYRLYNWEHKNLKAKLTMTSGSGTLMYQKTGEKDFSNNLYTAIPIDKTNSAGYLEVSKGASSALLIDGS